ncbi:MAG: hypothetical protein H0V17_33985 [Deltaproteobacteria bacterium]|nr:hypothetical protein [Deltaproteobacteria bacterium]
MRLSIGCVLLAACGITDFDITQPVPEQQVQGSGIPAPIAALFPLPLDLDLSAEIAKQTTGPIDSITLSSLELSITATNQPSGDDDTWDFVDEIHVFVQSSQSGSTLPRVEIASVTAPGAVTTMTFDVDQSIDITPYVDEGSVVESEASGTVPTDDVSYDGEAVFTVSPL